MLCAAVDVSDKWGEEMSDLIRREDAIKVLACEMYAEAQSQGYEVDSIEDFMPEAKAWMNDAPSADRPHGEWKRRLVDNGFNADWVCSECGYRIKTDFVDYNYCPNCGCRMKGADDE